MVIFHSFSYVYQRVAHQHDGFPSHGGIPSHPLFGFSIDNPAIGVPPKPGKPKNMDFAHLSVEFQQSSKQLKNTFFFFGSFLLCKYT